MNGMHKTTEQTHVLTIHHVKLTQSTAFEQERFELLSLLPNKTSYLTGRLLRFLGNLSTADVGTKSQEKKYEFLQ